MESMAGCADDADDADPFLGIGHTHAAHDVPGVLVEHGVDFLRAVPVFDDDAQDGQTGVICGGGLTHERFLAFRCGFFG